MTCPAKDTLLFAGTGARKVDDDFTLVFFLRSFAMLTSGLASAREDPKHGFIPCNTDVYENAGAP